MKLFDREWNKHRYPQNCYQRTQYYFPGDLDILGVHTPEHLWFYKLFRVWDMQAMLQKMNLSSSDKLKWISKHVLLPSISSNIQGSEYKDVYQFKYLLTN